MFQDGSFDWLVILVFLLVWTLLLLIILGMNNRHLLWLTFTGDISFCKSPSET